MGATRAQTFGLIGAPSSAGAYALGQERAPAALRAAGLVEALERSGVRVRDHGDVAGQPWTPDRASPFAQNLAAVIETIDGVALGVAGAQRDGEVALVLGGDCTVGLGTIRAVDAVAARAGVVYLDLHADMNVPTSVRDGALDWMGLGHALALEGCEPLLAARCSIDADRIALLGFDSGQATAWERDQLDALNLAVETVEALAAEPAGAARAALDALASCDRIAVHFDVDVIDFVDAPLSENTGRNLGVAHDSALEALRALLRDPRVAAVTVTELNPLHAATAKGAVERFTVALAAACATGANGA